eukprot:ctg_668.g316
MPALRVCYLPHFHRRAHCTLASEQTHFTPAPDRPTLPRRTTDRPASGYLHWVERFRIDAYAAEGGTGRHSGGRVGALQGGVATEAPLRKRPDVHIAKVGILNSSLVGEDRVGEHRVGEDAAAEVSAVKVDAVDHGIHEGTVTAGEVLGERLAHHGTVEAGAVALPRVDHLVAGSVRLPYRRRAQRAPFLVALGHTGRGEEDGGGQRGCHGHQERRDPLLRADLSVRRGVVLPALWHHGFPTHAQASRVGVDARRRWRRLRTLRANRHHESCANHNDAPCCGIRFYSTDAFRDRLSVALQQLRSVNSSSRCSERFGRHTISDRRTSAGGRGIGGVALALPTALTRPSSNTLTLEVLLSVGHGYLSWYTASVVVCRPFRNPSEPRVSANDLRERSDATSEHTARLNVRAVRGGGSVSESAPHNKSPARLPQSVHRFLRRPSPHPAHRHVRDRGRQRAALGVCHPGTFFPCVSHPPSRLWGAIGAHGGRAPTGQEAAAAPHYAGRKVQQARLCRHQGGGARHDGGGVYVGAVTPDAGGGVHLGTGRHHRVLGQGVRLLLGRGARHRAGVRGASPVPHRAHLDHQRDHSQPEREPASAGNGRALCAGGARCRRPRPQGPFRHSAVGCGGVAGVRRHPGRDDLSGCARMPHCGHDLSVGEQSVEHSGQAPSRAVHLGDPRQVESRGNCRHRLVCREVCDRARPRPGRVPVRLHLARRRQADVSEDVPQRDERRLRPGPRSGQGGRGQPDHHDEERDRGDRQDAREDHDEKVRAGGAVGALCRLQHHLRRDAGAAGCDVGAGGARAGCGLGSGRVQQLQHQSPGGDRRATRPRGVPCGLGRAHSARQCDRTPHRARRGGANARLAAA